MLRGSEHFEGFIHMGGRLYYPSEYHSRVHRFFRGGLESAYWGDTATSWMLVCLFSIRRRLPCHNYMPSVWHTVVEWPYWLQWDSLASSKSCMNLSHHETKQRGYSYVTRWERPPCHIVAINCLFFFFFTRSGTLHIYSTFLAVKTWQRFFYFIQKMWKKWLKIHFIPFPERQSNKIQHI